MGVNGKLVDSREPAFRLKRTLKLGGESVEGNMPPKKHITEENIP
jgi:hypothetical protein